MKVCEGIFDISNGLAVARKRTYGDNRETGSVSELQHTLTDLDETSAVCLL